MEGEYGGPIKLDMVRLRLAREVKEKDLRIQELTQGKVSAYQGCCKLILSWGAGHFDYP